MSSERKLLALALAVAMALSVGAPLAGPAGAETLAAGNAPVPSSGVLDAEDVVVSPATDSDYVVGYDLSGTGASPSDVVIDISNGGTVYDNTFGLGSQSGQETLTISANAITTDGTAMTVSVVDTKGDADPANDEILASQEVTVHVRSLGAASDVALTDFETKGQGNTDVYVGYNATGQVGGQSLAVRLTDANGNTVTSPDLSADPKGAAQLTVPSDFAEGTVTAELLVGGSVVATDAAKHSLGTVVTLENQAEGTDVNTGDVTVDTTVQSNVVFVRLEDGSQGTFDRRDLSSVGADDTTTLWLNLTVQDFDPDVLMGTADVDTWEKTEHADGSADINISLKPAATERNYTFWTEGKFKPSGWSGSYDASDNGMDAVVDLQIGSISGSLGNDLDGARLTTDAQAFTVPQYDATSGNLTFSVASPHCKDSASGNTCSGADLNDDGFYEAVIPQSFYQKYWGSDFSADEAVGGYSSDGGAGAQSVQWNITELDDGSLYINATNIHYSAGDINVSQDSTAPTADAGSGATVEAGDSVTLDGSASADNNAVDSYQWDVDGDGTYEATGQTASHTYTTTGTQTVTLQVTDPAGNTDTDTVTVTVEDTTAPTADVGADTTVDAGTSVDFDASGSTDVVGVDSYEWDFDGDGSTDATGAAPSHAFDAAGTYDVTVTVTDAAGNADTATRTVTVEADDSGDDGQDESSSGSADPDPDPVEVSRHADRVDVTVTDPADGVSVDLGSVGADDGGVAADRIDIQTTTDEPFTLNVSAPATAPDGTPEPGATDVGGEALGYLRVDHSVADAEVSGVTLRFTVDWETITAGTNENDVVLYRYSDGEWQALETSVAGYTETGARLQAESPGLSVFAVGTERTADLSVVDAGPDEATVTAGDAATVTATVENTGTAAGERTLTLTAGGETLATETVSLAPGESRTVEFAATLDASGRYDLRVDGVDAGALTVDTANTATATATATATPDPTPTATATATATPDPTPTATVTPTASADGPGFGAVAALVAVLIGALALGRRRD